MIMNSNQVNKLVHTNIAFVVAYKFEIPNHVLKKKENV